QPAHRSSPERGWRQNLPLFTASPHITLCSTSPLLSLLLFYPSPHPPYLHSFPTRRSSDLGKGRSGFVANSFAMRLNQLGKFDLKDRKSTRLNSSHVSISYAVFCLKKKREST